MIQDGFGYGKSSYWSYVAKNIAREQKESCHHFENENPIVKIKYVDDPSNYNVFLKIKCAKCLDTFPKTEKIIQKKFLEFYGK